MSAASAFKKRSGSFRISKIKLADGSSVYSAELCAIYLALKKAESCRDESFLIISDSLSALQALSSRKLSHPYLSDIHGLHSELVDAGRNVVFLWVPSHVGIGGNEAADKAAKAALDLKPTRGMCVPFSDLRSKSLNYSLSCWKKRWSEQVDNRLFKINPDLDFSFPLKTSNRKEETILVRLHTGHTWITHGFLLRGEDIPWCYFCDCPYSVKHVLTECADLFDLRLGYLNGLSNLREVFTSIDSKRLFSFLKEINLFSKI